MTEDVLISQLRLPSGNLALIDEAVRELSVKLAPSTWVDVSLLKLLLSSHPIRVKSVQRHYEVVGGFRMYHLAGTVCPADERIKVQLAHGEESELVQEAVMELVADALLIPTAGLEDRRRIYQVLRRMTRALNPGLQGEPLRFLSPKNMRMILNITKGQAERPRQRRSSYSKLLGAENG